MVRGLPAIPVLLLVSGACGSLAGQQAAPPAQAATAPLRLSLQEAIDRAVESNETVLIAQADQAQAAGFVREKTSGLYPTVSARADYTRNFQRPVFFFNGPGGLQRIEVGSDNEVDLAASLSQNVFDPALSPAVRAARLAREAAAVHVTDARTAVALATRQAYYDALLARDLVAVQQKALEQAQTRLDQVQAFAKAGTASEFDLLTAQVELENLKPPLIEAKNRRDVALNQLERIVGVPIDHPLELTDGFREPAAGEPSREASLEEALAAAQAHRPDLRELALEVELQEQQVVADKREYLPTLGLSALYEKRSSTDVFPPAGSDFANSLSAGLALNLDLFDGGVKGARLAQARAQLDRARYRLAQAQDQARLDVEQVLLGLDAARQRIEASRSTVERAERALSIAQLRFKNGLSTQVELNDAELAVTQARSNHSRALHAYSTAYARYLAAIGER